MVVVVVVLGVIFMVMEMMLWGVHIVKSCSISRNSCNEFNT